MYICMFVCAYVYVRIYMRCGKVAEERQKLIQFLFVRPISIQFLIYSLCQQISIAYRTSWCQNRWQTNNNKLIVGVLILRRENVDAV